MFMSTDLVACQTTDLHLSVRDTFLVPGCNGQLEAFGEARCGFCRAHIGRNHDVIGQVACGKVIPENRTGAQWVGGHGKESMHLWGVKHHAHYMCGSSSFK